MGNFAFTDALTGSEIEFDYSTGQCSIARSDSDPAQTESIFFPGCSMINYAMPLVEAVYNTLKEHGAVQGISFLCCGKILQYEPDGDVLRDAFEADLRDHVVSVGIKRIVCACPNCVKAMREAFEFDERTRDIKLEVLPNVLFDLGYRINKRIAARMIKGDEDADVLLCPHDSCPDRSYGEFADGLRDMICDVAWKDAKHHRKTSICCGSLPRAAGKIEQADRCANINGEEALDIGADAIVTPCMSCVFQLNMAQSHIQCVHFLELLYDWRIDWSSVGQWMKYRFLFNETLGADDVTSSRRFIALDEGSPACSENDGDDIVQDPIRDGDIAISNDGVIEIDS